jgi:uncharacterized membrane protein (DUF4010 family)
MAIMLELLSRLAVSLAIGLLIGLERGWHKREESESDRAAGLRTFALCGLLGGASGLVTLTTAPVVLGLIFLGYTAAFIAFHWLEARVNKDVGMTSVIAGLLTFILGAYAVMGNVQVAIACSVAMALVLALRDPLHKWISSLRSEEIRAVLILLAMTFLLLPLLPNRTIDPWNSINPSQIWMLAIMIAAISFGGYVAVRLFGDRLGVAMAGITGGLASSTATTLTLARLAKASTSSERLLAGGILLAGVVMVIRVGVVASLLNRQLIPLLWMPLVALALVQAAVAGLFLLRRQEDVRPDLTVTNPLELGTAIKLALLIAVVTVLTDLVHQYVGNAGVLIVAAISGIMDVDAITISMSRLGGRQLPLEMAAQAIALAVGVNTLAKAVMAVSVGGRRIGLFVGSASLVAVAAGVAVSLFA